MKVVKVFGRGLLSMKAKRLVEEIIENFEIREDSVVFQEAMEVEFGVFKSTSSVVLGSRIGVRGFRDYTSGWLFNSSRKFLAEKRVFSSELPLIPREYRLEIDVPGSGLMELPGYRLKNGVLLLYITPEYTFSFSSDVLNAGDLKDYAQLSIRPLENGFEGTVIPNLEKADYISIEIVGKIVEDQIFFGSEAGKVRYEFLPEKLLIISHEKTLDVPKLQKALELVSIVSGHGNFVLRLKVGKAGKEMRFSVFLPGE
ncbi:hypothetical protein [Thermococcus sp.]